MNYYALFKNKLDEKDLPYRELDNGVMEIIQSGENLQSIRVVIGFDEETSNRPWFKCYNLGRFEGDKYAAGLLVCNSCNKKYRWIRFYLDKDNDAVAGMDAIVSAETLFDEMIELIVRMIKVVDEVYPQFMKACWA